MTEYIKKCIELVFTMRRSRNIARRVDVRSACVDILNFTSAHVYANVYVRVGVSDFGLLGLKVPQNRRFPAHDTDEPPCKIWCR